jgi:ABC-type phosphate/phosphonate transport system substrate-binding protein
MKILSPPKTRFAALGAALVILLSGISAAPQSTKTLNFVGVNLDPETAQADKKLVKYLKESTGLEIGEEPQEGYSRIIRKLLEKKNEPYVARVTPYVYVVAQMMGAEFEILATYKNMSSNITTYHSWFVVRRDSFPELQRAPTLDELMQKIREQAQPATFIYHDKFSTSSYFLPSLEFRNRHIFSMAAHKESVTAIHSTYVAGSSSELVKRVAAGAAFLAAVWDGTKNKFQGEPEEKALYFVQIPTVLPNDLLVCSSHLERKTRDRIVGAIKGMPGDAISIGDFKTWREFDFDAEAKEALAALRHSAEQRPAEVTVRIGTSQPSPDEKLLATLETIKHAVRLSGSELIPFEKDYHKRADVEWNIEPIHDGAIDLTSSIKDSNLPDQNIEISFTDSEDLTRRIGNFIHSRMHLIRYIWPYDNDHPTVMRDADFPISAETQIKVMRITWEDPQRNLFSTGDPFDAQVVNPTPFGFQLASSEFPRTGNSYDFDPMSNISYRAILVRPSREGWMFTILTYLFVGLLAIGAAGAVWDMKRKPKVRDLPILNLDDFKRVCRELADKSRSFWRTRKLTEADVLWCKRDRLEELIADLKADTGNVEIDEVRTRSRSLAILANVPVVSKVLGLTIGAGVNVTNTTDPRKFSDTQRLSDTIEYLLNRNAFSPFVGEKLEWDALDQMANDIFKPFSLETSPADTNGSGALIRSENPMLLSAVARHFNEVIEQSKQHVCFFGKNWEVTKDENEIFLAYTAQLQSPIQLNGKKSTVNKLILRAHVPRDEETNDELAECPEVSAWLLGKITNVGRNGDAQTLVLKFQPTALVRTDD